MSKETLKSEITFWQFIGLVSLLVAVFGTYFAERNKIAVFYVLFLGILAYSSYKVYSTHKDIFNKYISGNKKKRNPYGHLIFPFLLEILAIISVGFITYFSINAIITLPKNDVSVIGTLFVISLMIFFRSINKNFEKKTTVQVQF